MRATSLGYGKRSDFTKWKGVGVPGPNVYESGDDFKNVRPQTPKWTFGTSRGAIKTGTGEYDKQIPGPGTYNSELKFGEQGKKYSMRPKTANIQETTNTALQTPGPGSYRTLFGINQDGIYFLSKCFNSKAAK